jgi:transposase
MIEPVQQTFTSLHRTGASKERSGIRMSKLRVNMDRLREMVRLYRKGVGCREVSRLLKMGPNTERHYRNALKAAGFLEGDEEELPSPTELKAVVRQYRPEVRHFEQQSSVAKWGEEIEEMFNRGAGPQAIFDALGLKHKEAFTGSLWSVVRYWRKLKRSAPVTADDVAIPVETDPGEVAQVDFGFVGKLYSPNEGILRKAWVFVMVLAFSRHMFCKVVFDQKAETWLQLHMEAFANFGGRVETVVPDNLKAAVIRAAFSIDDRCTLHRSYRELARHYGFKIDPAPPYSPKKKGKVESCVKYVKNNFFKPREFSDIDDANRQLDEWVKGTAGQRIHGTTGKRPLKQFEEIESKALDPLPEKRFEMITWANATVHRDGRILFHHHTYPVPWRFIGKAVWIRATRLSIEIYLDDVRIAAHQRGVPVPKEIADTYLPPLRTDLRHRSQSYWMKRAHGMGDVVGDFIKDVFEQDDVLSMLRPVQSMVTLLENYPAARAEAACLRAAFYANYKYRGLKNILIQGLDMQPLPAVVGPDGGGLANPIFARKPSELLNLKLEDLSEPN